MDLYYQNETLYIEISNDLKIEDYADFKTKIFRIIEDYGIDRIVIQNNKHIIHNRHLLNQMKQDFYQKYPGEFLIK